MLRIIVAVVIVAVVIAAGGWVVALVAAPTAAACPPGTYKAASGDCVESPDSSTVTALRALSRRGS